MLILPVPNRERDTKTERLLSKDYFLLMFTAFTVSLINHFLLAAKPLFIAYIGGSTLVAGLLITVYALSALVMRLVSGVISDKYGRVKLIIIGTSILAVFSVVNGITIAIPLLLALRVIMGFGFGMQSTCANAAVADVVPKERLAEGIGYFTLNSTLAQAIGPGIALLIVAGDTMKDYQSLFFISAALCAASTITSFFISYERKRKQLLKNTVEINEQSGDILPDRQSAIPDKQLPRTLLGFEFAVFLPMAVVLLLNMGIVSVFGFMAPFARWKDFGNPGVFYTITAIGVVVSRLFLGRVVDKRGSDIVVIPGILVLTLTLALLPIIESRAALFMLALPFGLSQGALFPTFNAMIFRRCSPARRGTAAGAYFTALDFGYAVGAPLLGALADALDFRYIFWAATVSAALALAVYLLACSDKRYAARCANANKKCH